MSSTFSDPHGGNSTVNAKRTTVSDVAYTVLSTDYLVSYTTLTATRAVTLPAASSVGSAFSPQFFIIKDEAGTAGTNALTFAANIDGATGKSISSNYGFIRLYSNGIAYFTW